MVFKIKNDTNGDASRRSEGAFKYGASSLFVRILLRNGGSQWGNVILETKNLTKAFANKRVVSGVNFVVCEGEITALLGENGAGKSTFKNMLVGLLEPTRRLDHI